MRIDFLKPPRLKVGDTVAAMTLSSGLASIYPHVFETAKRNLEQLFGLKVITTLHALKDPDWDLQQPQGKSRRFALGFRKPKVNGIISMIGGYESVRILPFVNHDLIRKHPKVLVGFSDSNSCLLSSL